jgi:hypothetical protein
MWVGQDSVTSVAVAFSLATNVMPLALTLACLAVLPAADRAFGLFPVMIFLAASMSASFASVADGPTAAAYTWLLLMLILFGPLTRWRLGGILLLAIGALRLHEATAFLGPILAFACLWRCRSTTDRASRIVLMLATLLIATGCAVAFHDVLHPRIAANRTSLAEDLVSLRWLLINGGEINIMALAGLVGLLALPALLLPPRGRALAMSAGLLVFAALTVIALARPPCPAAAFAARDNACLLTAPAMVVLLILRGRGWRLPAMSPMVMAMLGLTIAIADGQATAGWLGYTSAMRMALAEGHGVVPWRNALAGLPPRQAAALRRYAWPWTTPLMSIWLTPGPTIATVIANPSGVTCQPFNPDVLKRALARNDLAPTRKGVVTLLVAKQRRSHLRPANPRKANPTPVKTLGPEDRQRQAGRIGNALGATEEEGLGVGLIQLRLRRG